ncbi:hypothetical protein ABPG75_000342 [Micractinium tetrahymenae]
MEPTAAEVAADPPAPTAPEAAADALERLQPLCEAVTPAAQAARTLQGVALLSRWHRTAARSAPLLLLLEEPPHNSDYIAQSVQLHAAFDWILTEEREDEERRRHWAAEEQAAITNHWQQFDELLSADRAKPPEQRQKESELDERVQQLVSELHKKCENLDRLRRIQDWRQRQREKRQEERRRKCTTSKAVADWLRSRWQQPRS